MGKDKSKLVFHALGCFFALCFETKYVKKANVRLQTLLKKNVPMQCG